MDAWRRRRKKWKRWREGLVSCSSWEEEEEEEGEGQRGACLAYFISPPFFGILLYLGTFVMWERGRTKDKVCTAAFTLSRRAVLYISLVFFLPPRGHRMTKEEEVESQSHGSKLWRSKTVAEVV